MTAISLIRSFMPLGIKAGLFLLSLTAHAQSANPWVQQDSLSRSPATRIQPTQWALTAGAFGTAASQHYQPLWLIANRYQTISDRKADLSVFAGARATWHFRKNWVAGAGVKFYLNQHFSRAFLEQGYLKISYRKWQLRGGRFEEVVGEVHPALSSGSLGVSANALPIPKISLSTVGYVSVPLTRDWIQFKVRYSHGWMGTQQWVKNAMLHEKSLHLKVGKRNWGLYGGGTHFAQWGGKHPQGKLPSRFSDYLRIVSGSSGDGSDPVYQQGPIDIANAVGNHLAIFDIGFNLKYKQSAFSLYTQTIFERGTAEIANQRDRMVGFKLFSPDRLLGVSWDNAFATLLRGIAVEYLQTSHQGGEIIFKGRDNYYNHTIYRTGWVYHSQVIGTPLFMTRDRANRYRLPPSKPNDFNIVSNRIRGGSLGLRGQITEKITWRTLFTYLRHYGNYYNDSDLAFPYNQGHCLQEVTFELGKGYTATTALGVDFGELSNNLSSQLGVQWVVGK